VTRVLVTGGTGFIGHNAVSLLAERGYEVHVVGRSKPETDAGTGIVWHQADLLEPSSAASVVEAVGATHLLHFAWFAVPGEFWVSAENERWLGASAALVEAFAERGGERAVLAGTCAEYDWSSGICVEGVTPLTPTTRYGRCKLALYERVTELAHAGMSLGWGRIFFVYGPREHPARLVSSVIRSLLAGQEAKCTHGEQVRDFLHASDVASAFVSLLESDVDGPVNVGSGVPTTIKDVIARIGESIGRPELIRFGALPPRGDDPPTILADVRRLTEEVGWTPRISLDQGLEQTIAWWRAGESHDPPKRMSSSA
jgi:nucleoside-diphosphate-sugar epimerase